MVYVCRHQAYHLYGHRLRTTTAYASISTATSRREIEVRTARTTSAHVVDFSDIKRIVKGGWIRDSITNDPAPRRPLVKRYSVGEPIYIVESNPTVERIAKAQFDHSREHGIEVVA